MNRPHLSYIDKVRALRGEPHVTFPEGNASYPRTERVHSLLRADAIIAYGTAEPDSTRFPNHVLTEQEEISSDGHKVEVYRRYELLPGPVLIKPEVDGETGTPVTIATQRVRKPAGGTSASTFTIGTGSKAFTTALGLPFTTGTRVRAISTANPLNYMEGAVVSYSGSVLTLLIDSVGGSGTLSSWVFQFAGYAQIAGTEVTYQPANDFHGVKVEAALAGYALITRTESEMIQFTFPRLLTALNNFQVTARNGSVRVGTFPVGRAGFTALTRLDRDISYHASEAAANAAAPAIAYAPVLNDLVYNGVFYGVNERNVLNDAITVGAPSGFTTGTNNATWGYLVENPVTFGPSTPSATGYLALVGSTARVIGRDVVKWKYNLYRLSVPKVVLR